MPEFSWYHLIIARSHLNFERYPFAEPTSIVRSGRAQLKSPQHEGNRAVTESIGGHFNETSASLTMLLHLCRTDINTVRVHQLTTS